MRSWPGWIWGDGNFWGSGLQPLIVSLVGFVRLYLRAGRLWLAWTVCGLRTLSLILNFVCTPNLNFREITALRHVSFLGETVAVAEGIPNPWMLVGNLSLLLLVIFVADAAISVWQRGDRRQALLVGGSMVFFVVAGSGQAILALWGIIHAPITASLFFMGIVAAMGYELSQDLLNLPPAALFRVIIRAGARRYLPISPCARAKALNNSVVSVIKAAPFRARFTLVLSPLP